ncbi:hypothetical protein CRUP_038220 [Coryphaenoides rupestris]|nr:hypothetical protein CRUP_038220 [Coryphaenoides rupestris]
MTRTQTPLLLCLLALLLPSNRSSNGEASSVPPPPLHLLPQAPTPSISPPSVHHPHPHDTTTTITGLDDPDISTTPRDHGRNPQSGDNTLGVPGTTRDESTRIDATEASRLAGRHGGGTNMSTAAVTVVVATVVPGVDRTDVKEDEAREEKGEDGGRFSCPLSFSWRVCFVTLWVLAMSAALFLGLTIFFWVRLSARSGGQRLLAREGSPAPQDSEDMWAVRGSSPGERAEFWYTSPRMARQSEAVREGGRRQSRGGRREDRGEEEGDGLWSQPTVTLEDISGFWHSNGKVVAQE